MSKVKLDLSVVLVEYNGGLIENPKTTEPMTVGELVEDALALGVPMGQQNNKKDADRRYDLQEKAYKASVDGTPLELADDDLTFVTEHVGRLNQKFAGAGLRAISKAILPGKQPTPIEKGKGK